MVTTPHESRADNLVTDGYMGTGAGRYSLWWGTVLHGNASQRLITAIGNLYADMNGTEAGVRDAQDFPDRVAAILAMCADEHVPGDTGPCFAEGSAAGRCRHGYEYPTAYTGEQDVFAEVIAMAHEMSDEDLSAYVEEVAAKLDQPFSAVATTNYMDDFPMNDHPADSGGNTRNDVLADGQASLASVGLRVFDETPDYSYLDATEIKWVRTFLDSVHTVLPPDHAMLGDEALFATGISLWGDKSWVHSFHDDDHLDGARYLALRSFDGQMWLAAAVISESQRLTLSLLDYAAVVMTAGIAHDYWGTKRRRSSNGRKDFTRFEGTWHQGRLHYLLVCLCSYLQQTGDDRHVVLSQMLLGHLYGALVIPNYQVDIEMTSHGAMVRDKHAESLFRRVASILRIKQDVVTTIANATATHWSDAGKEVTLLCRPELQPCTSSQLGIYTHYGYLPTLRMSKEFCAAFSSVVCCLSNCEIESSPEHESRNRGIRFDQYLSTRRLAGSAMGAHYTVRRAAHAIAACWRARSTRTTTLGVATPDQLCDIDTVCGNRWVEGMWEFAVSILQTAGLSRTDTVRGRLGQMEMFEASWTDRRRKEDGGRFIPLTDLLSDTGQVEKMRVAWSNVAKVVYHEDSPAGRNLNYILALQYLSWAGARMT
jgi:hypothetical protein